MIRAALVCLCLGLAGATLAGCGKKGDPSLPEGQADTYPRDYPTGSTATDIGRRDNLFSRRVPRAPEL